MQTKVAVPSLIGMKYIDAKKLLKQKSLEMGAAIYTLEGGSTELKDQVIYKQNPQAKNDKGFQNYLQKGKSIDVWVVGLSPVIDTSKKIRIRTIGKTNSD